jgi:precorrin isomerase
MFDIFIMVDWSAANVPRTGRDSIWLCRRDAEGETLVNAPTRHAARELISQWLEAASGRRVLLGFDFPFGYPAGFAARLGLPGPPWRAVWDEIAALIDDDQENRNNRFDVAEALNRRVSGGGFPFWGCPRAPARTYLAGKHHRRHDTDGLAERRLVDLHIPSAQPCWKLLGTGSVGGQALTGIPVARALRADPRWRGRTQVWPFETGLQPPVKAQLVMAEVYPSLWAVKPRPDETKDAAQVRAVAGYLAARDQAGELAPLFFGDPGLTPKQREQVEREEAWTLGVTAARQRPIAVAVDVDPHSFTPAKPTPCSTRVAGECQSRQQEVRTRVVPVSSSRRKSGSISATGFRRYDEVASKPEVKKLTISEAYSSRHRRETGLPDEGSEIRAYTYLHDPAAITRKSLAIVRAEANLTRFPQPLRPVAARITHAAGDVAILDDLAFSPKAVRAGKAALEAGAPILVDATMVMAGINRKHLTAANELLCFLHDPAVPEIAAAQSTTRSAAAVELWRPYLGGAVVAIGNAPTALFRLLEILAEGAGKPALILGFPVGFVGAAESKAALAAFGNGIEFITLLGRRGGSAIAAAAVNALAAAR